MLCCSAVRWCQHRGEVPRGSASRRSRPRRPDPVAERHFGWREGEAKPRASRWPGMARIG